MKKKQELYEAEQNALIYRLLEVLDLDNESSFLLSTFDLSEEKQKQIMDLYPDVRKFFSLTNVQAIANPDSAQRPWLSLIKNVLKQKYKVLGVAYRLKHEEDETYSFTRRYFVQPKTI